MKRPRRKKQEFDEFIDCVSACFELLAHLRKKFLAPADALMVVVGCLSLLVAADPEFEDWFESVWPDVKRAAKESFGESEQLTEWVM